MLLLYVEKASLNLKSPICGMDMFKATIHAHTALAVPRSNQECHPPPTSCAANPATRFTHMVTIQ